MRAYLSHLSDCKSLELLKVEHTKQLYVCGWVYKYLVGADYLARMSATPTTLLSSYFLKKRTMRVVQRWVNALVILVAT